jgi:uncharacterized membrane protein
MDLSIFINNNMDINIFKQHRTYNNKILAALLSLQLSKNYRAHSIMLFVQVMARLQ